MCSEDKKQFIEGPCNCVNKILEETAPQGKSASFDIKQLVASKDFTLDVFNEKSPIHLACANDPASSFSFEIGNQKAVIRSPRVGLTLKRYCVEKEKKFWMADYRSVIFPQFHAKMKDYILLSMISAKTPLSTIESKANAKTAKLL